MRKCLLKIYVGNLNFRSTEETVTELFSAFGAVEEVALITDRDTGRPRGFGFVTMTNDDEAKKAIEELNGKDFEGRDLNINEARPRAPRQQREPRW
ncbi:MAG: RNA-binding protein [bacterium]|nr:RNA-binding protein [bacterium]MBT7311370.1 RNA-binding protein [bacterium]MCP4145850.1 RNA-binding protein [bacterium]